MGLSISSIALSGINAGAARLHTAADNISRRNVAGAAKKRVHQNSDGRGGVTTNVQEIPVPEETASDTELGFNKTNIDYAEESMQTALAGLGVKSSIRVFEVATNQHKSLLNIKI